MKAENGDYVSYIRLSKVQIKTQNTDLAMFFDHLNENE